MIQALWESRNSRHGDPAGLGGRLLFLLRADLPVRQKLHRVQVQHRGAGELPQGLRQGGLAGAREADDGDLHSTPSRIALASAREMSRFRAMAARSSYSGFSRRTP